MKASIHPTWYHNCAVTCSCGNTFTIGSTQETLQVDICNKCHPFFTGEVKFVDRQGRVDRFLKKQQVAAQKQVVATGKKKSARTEANKEVKSYRELLQEQQIALKQTAKAATSKQSM